MVKKGLSVAVFVATVGGALVLAQQPTPKPAERIQPQKQPADKGGMRAGMEEHIKEAESAMKPGPQHAQLQKLAGDWTVATKMEMTGVQPTDSTGTASIKSALGGRFLQESGSGEMMGEKTEHFKLWGFNNGTKKYEAVWTWTMSTSMLHMTGDSTDGGKTISWEASFEEEPGKKEEFKCSTSITDDDHFTVKLFGGKMPDGSDGPVMTMAYTRKK